MRPHCACPRTHLHKRGFTLVELMVTLTLVGIMLMMAVPSFSTWMRNAQIRSTAESLQNGLRLAKAQAAAYNRQVVFSLTSSDPALNAAASSTGLNWSIQTIPFSAGEDDHPRFIEGSTFGSSGVANVKITASSAVVCFNSLGRMVANATPGTTVACTTTAANFVVERASMVSGKDRPLTVTVSPAGQIRMCDPARSIATDPDGC